MAKAAVKKNEVATVQQGGQMAVPGFMKGREGMGTENLETADLEMPRIKLVQSTDQDLINTHDGLKVGDFWHTLAEVSLGSKLDVVPLYLSKRVVLWAPRPPIDKGGILARADDAVHWQPANREFKVKIDKKGTEVVWKTADTVAQSGLLEWGTYDPTDSNSQPAATLCHVLVVALPAFPEYSPVALMLQRTAVRPARKLLGKINIASSRVPIFGQVYNMASVDETSAAGQYKNYSFASNGWVQDQEAFAQFEASHLQFKKMGVQIRDMENADDGPVGTGEEATAPVDQKTGRSKY